MVTRQTDLGVLAWAVLATVALPLAACGASTRTDGGQRNGSGGSGDTSGATARGGSGDSTSLDGGQGNGSGGSGDTSGFTPSGAAGDASGSTASGAAGDASGSTGGSLGGTNGSGAGADGSTAMGGHGGDSGTAAVGSDDAGGGGPGGEQKSATFHWIEAIEDHRARAASSTKPAFLRTLISWPHHSSVLIGTSELIVGENIEEVYMEGFVWTEATGTTPLGGFPGANPNRNFSPLSYPQAISDDGSVVVGSGRDSQNRDVPFRWTLADGMEAIADEGFAVAVSADGSVILGTHLDEVFRWTRALGAVTIVEPLAGDDAISALALSADGAKVLVQSYRKDDSAARLVVWTEGSGTRVIENLPGHANCQVTSKSTGGFAVGGYCADDSRDEPFVWAGQDNLVALGPVDALGGYEPVEPSAVTADGSVAIGSTYEDRGYRWTEANGFELLELPDGYTNGAPTGMSEDGSVVVGTMDGLARRAFLWSESAGVAVLPPLEGHDVSEVHTVSADGSVAAGRSFSLNSALEIEDLAITYWGADGVAHSVASELAAGGVDLGGGALQGVGAAQAPLDFFGRGSKDQVSSDLTWYARFH